MGLKERMTWSGGGTGELGREGGREQESSRIMHGANVTVCNEIKILTLTSREILETHQKLHKVAITNSNYGAQSKFVPLYEFEVQILQYISYVCVGVPHYSHIGSLT